MARRRRILVLGICGIMAHGSLLAGELERICDQIHQTLSTTAGAVLTRGPERFRHEGRYYDGCLISVQGDHSQNTDPYRLLQRLYPATGSPSHREGWRAEREADGPDGSSFRLRRAKTFCLVQSSWDGGDDADPDYPPSSLFSIDVRCANLSP